MPNPIPANAPLRLDAETSRAMSSLGINFSDLANLAKNAPAELAELISQVKAHFAEEKHKTSRQVNAHFAAVKREPSLNEKVRWLDRNGADVETINGYLSALGRPASEHIAFTVREVAKTLGCSWDEADVRLAKLDALTLKGVLGAQPSDASVVMGCLPQSADGVFFGRVPKRGSTPVDSP